MKCHKQYLRHTHTQNASHLIESKLMTQDIVHTMQLLAQNIQARFELLQCRNNADMAEVALFTNTDPGSASK